MSEPSQKFEGVSFLGMTISYPTTFWGVLPFAIVCAAVVVLILFHGPKPIPRRLWIPAVVATNGDVLVLPETRQMNFWTPSVHTKDFLTNATGTNDPDRWQVLANEEPLMRFGDLLRSNSDVLGYRRTEVWGHGRSFFKPGWWWTVNVMTNFSATDLAHTYQTFWKSSRPVFIEVVDSRGSDQ